MKPDYRDLRKLSIEFTAQKMCSYSLEGEIENAEDVVDLLLYNASMVAAKAGLPQDVCQRFFNSQAEAAYMTFYRPKPLVGKGGVFGFLRDKQDQGEVK
jgi:hypothetical protein